MDGWKKKKEVLVFKGYRNMLQKYFDLPNGREAVFDILQAPSFVSIAALTIEKKVLLVKQFRPGPEQLLLSFPQGMIDEGEELLECAQRELMEESGYIAGEWVFVKEISEAYTNIRKYIFLALDCKKIAEPSPDDAEFIQLEEWSLERFRQMLKDPLATDFTCVEDGFLLLDYLHIR